MKLSRIKSFLNNPLLEYFYWIRTKYRYERKFNSLRVGYMVKLNNVQFGINNWISDHAIIENSSIGDFSYVSGNSVILETTMGKFCSIGPNVRTAPGKHPTKKFVSTHPALFSNPDYCPKNFFNKDHHNPFRHVEIGNDVWICANAVIADGVKIGDGAIIGANAVVTTDVEPYSIVGGVPAKHIRFRFEPDEINFLLDLKWWDKDIEWIEQNRNRFLDIKDMTAYGK